jgi:hypothetical protein
MEETWVEIYRKLFSGASIPSSGPCELPGIIPCCDCRTNFQIDLTNAHGPSRAIDEKEEYVQYSEQELPGLVKEELDATGEVSPEQRDLLISVLKSCQQKLPGMFLQARETSGAQLASEDRSHGSMSQSKESLGEIMPTVSPTAQGSFQPDFEIANYGSEDPDLSLFQFHEIHTLPPDIHPERHIPSQPRPDSGYNSWSKESNSIHNFFNSGFVNQSSSFSTFLDDGQFDICPPSAGQELSGPMSETVDNSTVEYDYYLTGPVHTAASDLERRTSGQNGELITSNIISRPGATRQPSSQPYCDSFDLGSFPLRN